MDEKWNKYLSCILKEVKSICLFSYHMLASTLHIGSVHPSESGTIAAFQGEKGESQLDEKGNVFNTFNLFQYA